MEKTLQEAFADRVKQLRSKHQLSQEDLCERSGLHPVQISYIENAQREPTLGTIQRISQGFGISISELMRGL